MDPSHAGVSPDEYVLRRIHKSHYDPTLPLPVTKAAVRPTDADKTGLSVYLERLYRDDPTGILAQINEAKRGDYYIARVRVADLLALGLRVLSDEGPQHLPGHCNIPELNRPEYEANKSRWADAQKAFAQLLGENIIHPPRPGTGS